MLYIYIYIYIIVIIYKKNVKYFLFFISYNDLFKAVDRLYSLLIKEKDLIDVNNVKIFDYKGNNFRLRR